MELGVYFAIEGLILEGGMGVEVGEEFCWF